MLRKKILPGFGIGIVAGLILGVTLTFLYTAGEKSTQPLVSQDTKDYLQTTRVGKDEAVEWIKIYKFRSQDLSNPTDRGSSETDTERRGGFSDKIEPTRYFSIPIQYIIDIFNTWNQDAGYKTKLVLHGSSVGFKGLRIYPMIYPNHKPNDKKRKMNLLFVPLDSNGYELRDYWNKTGEAKSAILMLPDSGRIYNEIGQCPPVCEPKGTLDNLSGN